jgi:hypothetical protein
MGYRNNNCIKKNYSKWNNFQIEVDERILNNLKQYMPIEGKTIFNSISQKSNLKSFRLTKNGISTGVFNTINNGQINMIQDRNEDNE